MDEKSVKSSESLRRRFVPQDQEKQVQEMAELTQQLQQLETEEKDLLQQMESLEAEESKVRQELDSQNTHLMERAMNFIKILPFGSCPQTLSSLLNTSLICGTNPFATV